MHARERIELDPVAGRGGRSWGRRLPQGSSSGLAWSWWGAEVVRVRVRARGLLYRRSEGVAVNRKAPASNYGEAMAWQGAYVARQHQGGVLVPFPR